MYNNKFSHDKRFEHTHGDTREPDGLQMKIARLFLDGNKLLLEPF